MNYNEPLAYRMKPKTLDDYVGQEHILGKDKILYRTIKADRLSSIILWGPPGCGKTSLAKVISNTTKYKFKKINAVSAGPIKTLSARGIKDFSTIQDVMGEKAPLRRNVTAHEVGDAVSFLFSNMSSAITGQIVYADAGYSIMGI